jgi:hypothetical protein
MAYFVEIAGWTGALLLLLAYGLVSAGRVASGSASYQLMNIVGAVGVVVNSGWNGAFPSVAVNIIWILIGAAALFRRERSIEPRT